MKRQLNYEILRIIAMILILFHHAMLYLPSDITAQLPSVAVDILSSGGKYGVILFILITGYFECNKEFKITKIFKLVGQTLFYSYLFLVLAIIINKQLDLNTIIRSLLPITFNQYWFITTYVILYLLIPFLNKLINTLSKKEFIKLILILSLFITILPSFALASFSIGSLGTFIYIYLIGSYLNKYSKFYLKNKNKFLVLSITLYIISIIVHILAKKYIGFYNGIFFSVNSFFFLGSAISLFQYFKKANISENFRKTIVFFSQTTFGVYLIHENIFGREIIWNDLFSLFYNNVNMHLLVLIILYVIIIYISFSIFDKIYIVLLKKHIEKLCISMYSLIDKLKKVCEGVIIKWKHI